MPKITPCLWFDGNAEDATNFYVTLLPDSRINSVSRSPADNPSTPAGGVLLVDFTVAGQRFTGLNGGPQFQFTEAVSFMIDCEDQAETDRLWAALTADGGSPGQCGWLKDRFGMSWQVIPRELGELLGDRLAGALDERLPAGPDSLRIAAWAGLQDSMPRAALLSIHARVRDTGPSTWEDPAFVQLWGPRFAAYVVAARDKALFSLGRFPDDAGGRKRSVDLAARLATFLGGRTMPYGDAGHGLGINPNALRYAAQTGTVLIRWDGGGRSTVWTVPPPEMDPWGARLELARRYLHVFGPATPESFAHWAGIRPADASSATPPTMKALPQGPTDGARSA